MNTKENKYTCNLLSYGEIYNSLFCFVFFINLFKKKK